MDPAGAGVNVPGRGREFGYICSRLEIERKVVVGHWKAAAVQEKVAAAWLRAAAAWHESVCLLMGRRR